MPRLTAKVTGSSQGYHIGKSPTPEVRGVDWCRQAHGSECWETEAFAGSRLNQSSTINARGALYHSDPKMIHSNFRGPILFQVLSILWSNRPLTLMLEAKLPLPACFTSVFKEPATNPNNHLGLGNHLTCWGKDVAPHLPRCSQQPSWFFSSRLSKAPSSLSWISTATPSLISLPQLWLPQLHHWSPKPILKAAARITF